MKLSVEISDDAILSEAAKRSQKDVPTEVQERILQQVQDQFNAGMAVQLNAVQTILTPLLGEMVAAVADIGEEHPDLPGYLQEIAKRHFQAFLAGLDQPPPPA